MQLDSHVMIGQNAGRRVCHHIDASGPDSNKASEAIAELDMEPQEHLVQRLIYRRHTTRDDGSASWLALAIESVGGKHLPIAYMDQCRCTGWG
jgi:hypothetical protein